MRRPIRTTSLYASPDHACMGAANSGASPGVLAASFATSAA
ncbi:Uncharacterised protein [Mycobacteroides abscessus subsp. abscessus]|nr:Uncharacterised protein [Mycobacteroides abscessus subsp. abscessus]